MCKKSELCHLIPVKPLLQALISESFLDPIVPCLLQSSTRSSVLPFNLPPKYHSQECGCSLYTPNCFSPYIFTAQLAFIFQGPRLDQIAECLNSITPVRQPFIMRASKFFFLSVHYLYLLKFIINFCFAKKRKMLLILI